MRPGALTLSLAVAIALIGILVGAMLGVVNTGPLRLLAALLASDPTPDDVLIAWRVQRVTGAFLVGACLAIAGVIYQGSFRNPLAEPFLLGSSAGGALGAVFAILLPLSWLAAVGLPILAFVGAWGATLLVLAISRAARIEDAAGMLLVGIALAALLGALRSTATLVLSDESVSLRALISWTLGGLQSPTGATLLVFAVLTAVCLIASLGLARRLDILGFGESTAATMGVDVGRFLTLSLTVAAFATGLAVAWGGVLAFVGLIVPHTVRWWIGERHAPLLLHSAFVGGGFLAILDGLSRSLLAPSEIPLGLLTSLIGAPFFLLLLVRRYR
ncbi:iron ABC transporter permease [Hyphomicrobium sp.]|uniref:FecCD family ABC transporter permease n=1 Tax=Hyphomicrobium sp. TaxID=82 RepID=UPI0025C106F3|nr:iron ABC transporter permease [Hyphomicrobium sp.]MCC7250625.1 iron ABC transporter permease [Hyphomicrobium sp.]